MKGLNIQTPVLLITGFLALSILPITAAERTEENARPKIKQDPSPLPADIKARTSFSAVAKKIGPSVVNVYSTRKVRERAQLPFFNDPFFRRFFGGEGGEGEGGGRQSRPHTQEGLGSGVIVSEDGYIITNNHVVEDSSDIRVALVSGEEYPAKVVGTD